MLSPTSLVLVCLLPTPRDLEIARLLGWYRIPFKSAPKVVAVDYLAFYQAGNLGEQGSQIQYVAKVMGHELTTRLELLSDEPDHPRAREEYYKIQIGGLEKLPQPVKAEKWRRITFLYTTGEYLLNAKRSTTWWCTVRNASYCGVRCTNGWSMISNITPTSPNWRWTRRY
jgi:hypothetical protein